MRAGFWGSGDFGGGRFVEPRQIARRSRARDARQLIAGSVPRVTVGEHKKTTVAQQEVVTKVVEKIETETPVK